MPEKEDQFKPALFALIVETRRIQRDLIASLTDVQRAESGTIDHWTLKDLISHLTFWTAASVRNQQLVLRGEPLPDLDNFQQHNDRVFVAHRDQPWPEVIAASEASYDALLALLDGYSEAQLAAVDGFPDSTRLLWSRISGNLQHSLVHFSEHFIERNEPAQAIAIQAFTVENSRRVNDPRASAYATYNLACMHARLGESAQALALLPDSLRGAPDLVEWSKEDPDLVSLHGQADYEALYASS